MKKSAGLVLFRNINGEKSILLVHPSNASWNGTYSIPKGMVDETDDDLIETAIRETNEECGIIVNRSEIKGPVHSVEYKKSDNAAAYKTVYFYVVDVTSYDLPDTLPHVMLQIEEVDHAKFFTKEESKNIIFWRLKKVFDLV
jgi:predicted NUDIX family NTP pyrophosphohydrolase